MILVHQYNRQSRLAIIRRINASAKQLDQRS